MRIIILRLDGLPLAVIIVTEHPILGDVLTRLQNELPALSANSIHVTETGATHENLVARQDHALAWRGRFAGCSRLRRPGARWSR